MSKIKLIIPVVIDSEGKVFVYNTDYDNNGSWEYPILSQNNGVLKKDINDMLLKNFGIRVGQVSENSTFINVFVDGVDVEFELVNCKYTTGYSEYYIDKKCKFFKLGYLKSLSFEKGIDLITETICKSDYSLAVKEDKEKEKTQKKESGKMVLPKINNNISFSNMKLELYDENSLLLKSFEFSKSKSSATVTALIESQNNMSKYDVSNYTVTYREQYDAFMKRLTDEILKQPIKILKSNKTYKLLKITALDEENIENNFYEEYVYDENFNEMNYIILEFMGHVSSGSCNEGFPLVQKIETPEEILGDAMFFKMNNIVCKKITKSFYELRYVDDVHVFSHPYCLSLTIVENDCVYCCITLKESIASKFKMSEKFCSKVAQNIKNKFNYQSNYGEDKILYINPTIETIVNKLQVVNIFNYYNEMIKELETYYPLFNLQIDYLEANIEDEYSIKNVKMPSHKEIIEKINDFAHKREFIGGYNSSNIYEDGYYYYVEKYTSSKKLFSGYEVGFILAINKYSGDISLVKGCYGKEIHKFLKKLRCIDVSKFLGEDSVAEPNDWLDWLDYKELELVNHTGFLYKGEKSDHCEYLYYKKNQGHLYNPIVLSVIEDSRFPNRCFIGISLRAQFFSKNNIAVSHELLYKCVSKICEHMEIIPPHQMLRREELYRGQSGFIDDVSVAQSSMIVLKEYPKSMFSKGLIENEIKSIIPLYKKLNEEITRDFILN